MQDLLREALHTDINLLESVNDGLLSHSGKMLRPMLCLLMARACGTVTRDSIRFAAATEILHNATLLHDDVADQSLERRGEPTVYSRMGASSAVLVGDFWLARAVEVVLEAEGDREVVKLFSKTLTDLAEGEMLQLEKAESADTDIEAYKRIIFCKTASLFVAAAASGAFSVSAPEQWREAASAYAKYAGIAFQIKDDILDYAGDEALGKPVGIDLQERKITLPLLCAMQGSGREAQIRAMVRDIPANPGYADEIRSFVRERGGVAKAAQILDEYIDKAVRSLDVLPDSEAKSYLAELVRYNALRRV